MENVIKKQWPEGFEKHRENFSEFPFNPQSGVYFLFENNELIYIGMATDIYTRVFCHSKTVSFDRVWYIPVENDIETVERHLIQHFRPRLNITDNPDNAPQKQEKAPDIAHETPESRKSHAIKQDPKYKVADLPAILSNAPREMLWKVLSTISDIERDVIIKRHGLFNRYPHTLQYIADEYNLTRERIRQIQRKAERKILHPSRMSRLSGGNHD